MLLSILILHVLLENRQLTESWLDICLELACFEDAVRNCELAKVQIKEKLMETYAEVKGGTIEKCKVYIKIAKVLDPTLSKMEGKDMICEGRAESLLADIGSRPQEICKGALLEVFLSPQTFIPEKPVEFELLSMETFLDRYNLPTLNLTIRATDTIHLRLLNPEGNLVDDIWVWKDELQGKDKVVISLHFGTTSCQSVEGGNYTLEVYEEFGVGPFYTEKLTFLGTQLVIQDLQINYTYWKGTYDITGIRVWITNKGDIPLCEIIGMILKVNGKMDSVSYIREMIKPNATVLISQRIYIEDLPPGNYTAILSLVDTTFKTILTYRKTITLP